MSSVWKEVVALVPEETSELGVWGGSKERHADADGLHAGARVCRPAPTGPALIGKERQGRENTRVRH